MCIERSNLNHSSHSSSDDDRHQTEMQDFEASQIKPDEAVAKKFDYSFDSLEESE